MNDQVTSKTESKQPAAESEAVKKAKVLQAAVKAEIAAILTARQAYHAALAATGEAGLQELAIALGQSVDKFGYPGFPEYTTFTACAALQKIDHVKFDRLARVARNAIGTNADKPVMSKDEIANAATKFLTGTAKRSGNGDASRASVKIKAPKALDVAVGGN